ncbi:MAG: nucleoside recognition protein [Firmicutes bacterium]|nr:nucleoside recognition protein [Bacillota bacterium]
MITKGTLWRGLKAGLETTWELAKVIIPIYMIVTVLKYTGIIEALAKIFAPLMQLVGLPGEAAMVLAMGYTLNLYAAIGAILSLSLSMRDITILALMVSFAHNLFVETAVSKKAGVKIGTLVALRVGLSFLSGMILNFIL